MAGPTNIARILSRLLLALLIAAPATYCAYSIANYSVNVPYWDEWDVLPRLYLKASEGNLTLGDLTEQHNEHRLFVPRVIALALAPGTHGDARALMWANFAFLCLAAGAIGAMLWRTLPQRWAPFMALWALANGVLFTGAQMENWLWGIQIQLAPPDALLLVALALLARDPGRRGPTCLFCMALAALSMFSEGSGVIVWIVLLPLWAWPRPAEAWGERKWWTIVWAAGLALCLAVYLAGYSRPRTQPPLTLALERPLAAMQYFLAFLGGCLGSASTERPLVWAMMTGTTELTILALLAGYVMRRRQDRDLVRRAWVWGAPALYALGCAALTAAARVNYGAMQALSSRYATMSMMLPLGLIGLAALVYVHARAHDARLARKILPPAAAAAVALLVLELLADFEGLDLAHSIRLDRLEAKADVLMIEHFQDVSIATVLCPHPERVKPLAETLERLGYLHPGLVRTNRVEQILGNDGPELGVRGSLQYVHQDGPHEFDAHGWAVFSNRRREADAVLLTIDDPAGQAVIVGLGYVGYATDQAPDEPLAGWDGKLRLMAGPDMKLRLRAWAFNTSTAKAYPIAGSAILTPTQP